MTEEDKKALTEAVTWFRWGMRGNGFVGFDAQKCARTIEAILAALAESQQTAASERVRRSADSLSAKVINSIGQK